MIALVGAAIAPGIALLCYFYLRDHLQPEPISMVIRSFLFGIMLVLPIMMLQYIMQNDWHVTNEWLQAVFSAALIEELFKWLVVYQTAYKHVEFDEPYDGIVYAVAISLGFATLENFFYLWINGTNIAFWRALLPVSGHALFGIWMGYYLGKGKFTNDPGLKSRRLVLSLLIPVLLHAVYNIIFLNEEHWIWMILPFMLLLWWLGLKKVEHAHQFGSKTGRTRPH